jgi:photosystem II stability/assembly factor-like uncharacterized protein
LSGPLRAVYLDRLYTSTPAAPWPAQRPRPAAGFAHPHHESTVRNFRFRAVCALALLVAVAPVSVQAQRGQAVAQAPASTLVAGVPDSAVLSGLRFRSIGPAIMSGRISDIAVPAASQPGARLAKTFYVATAAGGVWKTTNGGVNFDPVFDGQRVSSIGAVAVAPTNADVVWVGTGESNNLRSSSWGDGVYRSTDAGRTWTHMGLRQSQHIARIVVHPSDENTVFVAAMGPLWAGGGERGFYRTADGGRTWQNTLSAGPYTGVTDIVLDPRNPDVVYATTYQRDRRAYSFVGGGPESGIWKSEDGGRTWTELTEGLPTTDKGRIGLDIARSQPNTIYATVDASPATGGVYRSDDAGASWRRVNELQSIPWFFGQIRVDPLNAERIYHLGVSLSVSDDGGQSFRRIAGNTHADHHAMWIDPNDSDHLIIGNDGGLYLSHDRGASWDFALNLPAATFYAIGVDMRDPYWVYGGLQDNGTFGAPSSTRTNTGVTNADWVRVAGGDGFYAAIDPVDYNIVYAESQNGALQRFDLATQERKSIRPPAEQGVQHRYNWMAPLIISPHDRATLYFAANYVFRSTDRGDSWERLGDDLTRNLNRDSLPIMGLAGPGGHRRNEGVADFGNITTIDESPLRKGLLYVGTDDGLVQVSRAGGSSWTRIERFPGVPDMTYVSRVVASAHHEGTLYVTLEGHRSNDFRPYVLKSSDYGRTFNSIASNLPQDAAVYVIREHHRNPDLLVVGTEYGVFVTLNGGGSWTQLEHGIAPAPVHDVIIHPRANDLIVGTHGRGIYILDDITPLESLARAGADAVRLFQPQPATIQNTHSGFRLFGNRNYTTENPRTRGAGNDHSRASFAWFMGRASADAATGSIAILDPDGTLVREIPVELRQGLNRTEWDLRWSMPSVAAPAPPRRTDEEEEGGPSIPPAPGGPFVFPGTYTAQLRLQEGGAAPRVLAQTSVQVRPDPALLLPPQDYRALHETRMRALSLQTDIADLVTRLSSARQQLDDATAGRDSAGPAVPQARQLRTEIDELLVSLRGQPRPPGQAGQGGGFGGAAAQGLFGRVTGVATAIGSMHFLPTPQHHATLADAAQELGTASARAATLLAGVEPVLRALNPR